jgi:predicted N-formylglutamate amidohydrolase
LISRRFLGHNTPVRPSIIVSAEHASSAVPDELARLGLAGEDLVGHHAWDPGAEAVARRIAGAFGAPLFLGRWSRLVADLNRPASQGDAVPEVSYGLVVPGNRGLSPDARARRLERYHAPYWREVIGAIERAGPPVLHLSIHSFTPEYEGRVRRVSIGVLIDPDRPLERSIGERIVERLSESWVAGVNEPYDGRAPALTTSCRERFDGARYAGIEIEMNQRHLPEIDRLARDLIAALEAL